MLIIIKSSSKRKDLTIIIFFQWKFIFLIEQKDVVAILIVILNEWQINKMMRQQIAATSILGNKKNRLLWLQRSKEWKENSSNVSVIFWFCNFSLTRYSRKNIWNAMCMFRFCFHIKVFAFLFIPKNLILHSLKDESQTETEKKELAYFIFNEWMNVWINSAYLTLHTAYNFFFFHFFFVAHQLWYFHWNWKQNIVYTFNSLFPPFK